MNGSKWPAEHKPRFTRDAYFMGMVRSASAPSPSCFLLPPTSPPMAAQQCSSTIDTHSFSAGSRLCCP